VPEQQIARAFHAAAAELSQFAGSTLAGPAQAHKCAEDAVPSRCRTLRPFAVRRGAALFRETFAETHGDLGPGRRQCGSAPAAGLGPTFLAWGSLRATGAKGGSVHLAWLGESRVLVATIAGQKSPQNRSGRASLSQSLLEKKVQPGGSPEPHTSAAGRTPVSCFRALGNWAKKCV